MDGRSEEGTITEPVHTFYETIADDAAWCYFDDAPYKVSAEEPVPRPIKQEQTQYPVRVDIQYTPDLDIPENPSPEKYAPQMAESDITGRIVVEFSQSSAPVDIEADVSDSWHHPPEELQDIVDAVDPDDPLEADADKKRVRISTSSSPARSPAAVYATAADVVAAGRQVVDRLAHENIASFRQRVNQEGGR
ncbi:MAG: hypothetical protein SVY41_03395 [Candidatus Nanohaloarchaea archaeon]|nr:hypothetical protein [Candidatus Nanohaloarchaea archaeon]